jgi:hypothetical protein
LKQLAALSERSTARLKPGERRYVRSVIDNIARRIVAWRELSRDEPELAVWLDTLAEQVRTLQTRALEDATALTGVGTRDHGTEER